MANWKMRAASVILTASMAAGPAPAAFAASATTAGSDIDGHWAQNVMEQFISDGLLNGDGDGNYRPNSPISRAEYAALLNRIMNLTQESSSVSNYTDVASSSWYYSDMAKALARGYMNGTSATTMAPTQNVTREQAFVMVARILGLDTENADLSSLDAFSDKDSISEYAKPALAAMVSAGYVKGSDGKLSPKDPLTRAEGVTVLNSTKDKLEAAGGDTPVTPGSYKDGVYTGTGAGYGGTMTCQVTIEGGKITDIQILSHSETGSYLTRAKTIIDKIINNQSTDGVDTVSGATKSSNGILTAVGACLSQAQGGADTSTTGSTGGGGGGSSSTNSSTGEIVDNGDGTVTLTGTSVGYSSSGITVSVVVDTGTNTITSVTVTKENETSSYYDGKKVEENLLPQFVGADITELAATGTIKKNKTAVTNAGFDNVSGATYSTAGIINAVIAAVTDYLENSTEDNSLIEVSTWDEFLVALDKVDEGGTISLLNDIAAGDSWYDYLDKDESGNYVKYVDSDGNATDSYQITKSDVSGGVTTETVVPCDDLADAVTAATIGIATFNKACTVEGNNHRFYAADDSAFCFYISGVEASMQNLTIDGAIYGKQQGGAIYVAKPSGDDENEAKAAVNPALTLDNVTVSNCSAINEDAVNGGGAVYAQDATLTIKNSKFENNSATNRGGAIYIQDTEAEISGSSFVGNSAAYGGAINVSGQNSALTVSGSSFSNNDSKYGGNDIYIYDGSTPDVNGTQTSQIEKLELSANTYGSYTGEDWKDYAVLVAQYGNDTSEYIYVEDGHVVQFTTAARTEIEEEITEYENYYVMMNIPYGVFYASENLAEGTYFDAVSTATTSKGTSTTGLARGTYNNYDGTNGKTWEILGVVAPVKVNAETYKELSADYSESTDYSFYALSLVPDVYKTVTYNGGTYTFSAMESDKEIYDGSGTNDSGEADKIGITAFVTNSSYGDYMFDLYGVANAPDNAELAVLDASKETIYGIILKLEKNGREVEIGLNNVEHMWLGARYTYTQIAFSIPEGKQLTNHGGIPFTQFEGINGATIKGIRILSSAGIYDVETDYSMPEYYSGDGVFAASGEDGSDTISVTVPDDFNATGVSVSYRSGRSTKYIAEDIEIAEDGTVSLNESLDVATNGSYTVTISSGTYADKVITLEAMMSEFQKYTLTKYIEIGNELLEKDSTLSRLEEHIAEAEGLLLNPDTTYTEAAELIEELAEIIKEAGGNPTLEYYAMMNIPYGDFYASEGLAEGAYFDAVTSATANKTTSTTGTAKGTYNNYDDNGAYDEGEQILGVVVPVRMTVDTYTALAAAYDEQKDYSFYVLSEAPEVYKNVSYADGVYSFSEMVGDTYDGSHKGDNGNTDKIGITEFVTNSNYGDYMFDLYGVANNDNAELNVLDTRNETIYGVILTLEKDGKESEIGLNMIEHLWPGTRYTYLQVAFSIPEGKQLTNHGGVPFTQFEGINGATIEKIKILSSAGIYDVDVEDYTMPIYYDNSDGAISAAGNNGDNYITVTAPDDFGMTGVSVSYTVGTGRQSKTVYVAENAEVIDGKVTLNAPIDISTNGTYTVTLLSSSYCSVSISLEAPMSEEQRTTLQNYIATGKELLSADSSLSRLAEHVAEAEELLADENTTYSEAAELIAELEEIIAEASSTVSAADTAALISPEAEDRE